MSGEEHGVNVTYGRVLEWYMGCVGGRGGIWDIQGGIGGAWRAVGGYMGLMGVCGGL